MTSTEVIVRRAHGPVTEAAVIGDIDLHTAPYVRQTVLDLIERGHRQLVLDLSEVRFCDSTGLSVLIIAWHAAHNAGGRLSLAAVPDTLLGMLALTGVDAVMAIYPTIEDALSAHPGAHTP